MRYFSLGLKSSRSGRFLSAFLLLITFSSSAFARENTTSIYDQKDNHSLPSYSPYSVKLRESSALDKIRTLNSIDELKEKNLSSLRSKTKLDFSQEVAARRTGGKEETPDSEEAHGFLTPEQGFALLSAGGPAVKSTGVNKPPVVSAIIASAIDVDSATAGLQVYKNTVVTYIASATDPNNDVLSWQWSYKVDSGTAKVYSSGIGTVESISFDYSKSQVPSVYDWTLSVSDGRKSAAKTYRTQVVTDPTNNQPPVLNPISVNIADADPLKAGYQVNAGTIVTYSSSATDIDNDVLQWKWVYSVDGGAEVTYKTGSGAIQSALFDYTGKTTSTYVWKLRTSDASHTVEQTQTTLVVGGVAPPPSSKPLIYLDFNGDFNAQWGSYTNITTPAYDRDSDLTNFSASEMLSIEEIKARVIEYFSPFNLEVKTNFDFATEPTIFNDREAMHVIIGGSSTWLGATWGGYAYYDSFWKGEDAVYVFENNLGNGNPKYTADAIAHEVGHSFGLRHHGSFDANGVMTAEYDRGTSLAAPIMGTSYYAQRGLWSYGPTSSATTMQDDLAVITNLSTNGFGYKQDDYGSTAATATTLSGFGTALSAYGVIEKSTDADYFKFSTVGGTVSIAANVAKYGAMLDLSLELRDINNNLIAIADTTTLGESLLTTLAAGDYYIVVKSHGNYGDLGQYWLNTTLPV